jgi:acetyl-CoA carboxylase carboxyl transferase subunit beta
MPATSAAETLAVLADPGSFEAFPDRARSTDPLGFADTTAYPDRLAAARAATGVAESVRAGRARIAGAPVALLVSEYGFIGGSIGAATGELISRTFERAAAERLPVVAVTRSGGTRMQEGNYGFTQIAKTLATLARFRRSGLPYVVYLAHPTIGGVLASWGSAAHMTFAEPGALIGFAGPRGVEASTGSRLPPGVQRAENLAAHGLVDDLVPLAELREKLAPLLGALGSPPAGSPPAPADVPARDADAWESVRATREPERPGARELLAGLASQVTDLRGDGEGAADDPAMLTRICRLGGVPVTVIAHDKSAGPAGARPSAAGYRKARRGVALAGELALPIVTVVDTPGAELSRASEEGGLAGQLAGCLADLLTTPSPVLSLLLGQGGGGGALALLGGDVVLATRDAWLAPIAPEAASAILYGDAARAAGTARAQGVTAGALRDLGLVDHVVDEPAAAVAAHLPALLARPGSERLAARYERYRRMGNGSVHMPG